MLGGGTVNVDADAFLRLGLPEANAATLPVPPNTDTAIATPTATPKFAPPFLASAAAAGNVKVGNFAAARRRAGAGRVGAEEPARLQELPADLRRHRTPTRARTARTCGSSRTCWSTRTS